MPLLEVHRYLEGGDIDVVRSAAGFRLGSYVQVIKMPRDCGQLLVDDLGGKAGRTLSEWALGQFIHELTKGSA